MTVAGWTVPSASKTCVMPTFLPMIPVTISITHDQRGTGGTRRMGAVLRVLRLTSFVLFSERLDFDVDARRQVELHQRVDGLRRRLEDVDQPLVRADLELLARLLVDVRRAEHGPLVLRR